MKRIGEIRAKLAWIHTYRNLAVSAVNDRSDKMLRDNPRFAVEAHRQLKIEMPEVEWE